MTDSKTAKGFRDIYAEVRQQGKQDGIFLLSEILRDKCFNGLIDTGNKIDVFNNILSEAVEEALKRVENVR